MVRGKALIAELSSAIVMHIDSPEMKTREALIAAFRCEACGIVHAQVQQRITSNPICGKTVWAVVRKDLTKGLQLILGCDPKSDTTNADLLVDEEALQSGAKLCKGWLALLKDDEKGF